MGNATADAVTTGFSTVLNRIDAQHRFSLTDAQGHEMTLHERLSEITGAYPRSP